MQRDQSDKSQSCRYVIISMQGSGISNVDTAGAEIKLNDDGFYTLKIGATDMGTWM